MGSSSLAAHIFLISFVHTEQQILSCEYPTKTDTHVKGLQINRVQLGR